MKIRMCFVSNSSSSSFCIMGVNIPKDDERREILESTDDLKDHYGISVFYEEIVYGLDVCDMKEDETLKDFKNRVLELINKNLPDDKKFSISDISWKVDGGADY